MSPALFTFLFLSVLFMGSKGEAGSKIPIKLLKAGASLKSEFQNNQPESEVSLEQDPVSAPAITGGSGEVGAEHVEYSDEAEGEEEAGENECGHGEYWHIRGSRCVPLRCPTRRRDPATGQCRLPYSGRSGTYGSGLRGNVRYYRYVL